MIDLLPHAARSLRRDGPPLYLLQHVTRRCPLSCAHCFLPAAPFRGTELDVAEFERIAASVPRLLALNVTGGEPFLRPDLAEIILAYRRYSRLRLVQVATAGQDAGGVERVVREVLTAAPELYLSVVVSLDGLAPVHDAIRGRQGCFDAAMDTVSRLRALSRRFPSLDPAINVTVADQPADELRKLYAAVNAAHPGILVCFALARGRSKAPNIDAAAALLRCIERDGPPRRTFLGGLLRAKDLLARDLAMRVAAGARVRNRCTAGTTTGVVWADGTMTACEARTGAFVSLRDFGYDLRRAWASRTMAEDRRAIGVSRCLCTHECYWTTNILFGVEHYPGLVARWIKDRIPISRLR